MKTVVLEVRSPDDAMADVAATLSSGKAQKTARISFATPVSIREAARRVGRDVKAVHTDATVLLVAGVLDRTTDGQIEFPYDAVKVEFLLQAA